MPVSGLSADWLNSHTYVLQHIAPFGRDPYPARQRSCSSARLFSSLKSYSIEPPILVLGMTSG